MELLMLFLSVENKLIEVVFVIQVSKLKCPSIQN